MIDICFDVFQQQEVHMKEKIRKGYFGKTEYTSDGKHIREGHFGKVKYTIDGNHIRKGYFGPVEYGMKRN